MDTRLWREREAILANTTLPATRHKQTAVTASSVVFASVCGHRRRHAGTREAPRVPKAQEAEERLRVVGGAERLHGRPGAASALEQEHREQNRGGEPNLRTAEPSTEMQKRHLLPGSDFRDFSYRTLQNTEQNPEKRRAAGRKQPDFSYRTLQNMKENPEKRRPAPSGDFERGGFKTLNKIPKTHSNRTSSGRTPTSVGVRPRPGSGSRAATSFHKGNQAGFCKNLERGDREWISEHCLVFSSVR